MNVSFIIREVLYEGGFYRRKAADRVPSENGRTHYHGHRPHGGGFDAPQGCRHPDAEHWPYGVPDLCVFHRGGVPVYQEPGEVYAAAGAVRAYQSAPLCLCLLWLGVGAGEVVVQPSYPRERVLYHVSGRGLHPHLGDPAAAVPEGPACRRRDLRGLLRPVGLYPVLYYRQSMALYYHHSCLLCGVPDCLPFSWPEGRRGKNAGLAGEYSVGPSYPSLFPAGGGAEP